MGGGDGSGAARRGSDPLWLYALYPVALLNYLWINSKPNPFYAILEGRAPATILHEDDLCIVFRDIFPLSSTHLLVIPREHIHSWPKLDPRHAELVEHLHNVGKMVLSQEGVEEDESFFGFMTPPFISVPQLHLHCLRLPLKAKSPMDRIRKGIMLDTSKMMHPERLVRRLNRKRK